MTDPSHELLIAVWREACRHAEIGDSVASIVPLLGRALPLDLVLVLRLDETHSHLETLASVGQLTSAGSRQRQLEPGHAARLAAWCRSGDVAHEVAVGASWPLAELLPAGAAGDVLVGPLRDGDQALGVLLLLARAPARFDETQVALARSLLEPFSVALANDRQFREMARLREAVEADNRAILSRLQRDDISETVVGAESGLREVMEQVEKVAPTEAPVLILGETGSGKEVIARAIHERSRRAQGPVVRVNCGAIPSELIDSELFGHERGSFTGAVATRKGWFERADGGTLFLDEIAELPLAAQVRLLRILQDGGFERVGGGQPRTVDVRLVAATHRDLQEMVARGSFREDLWYRISVFPIRLPALRERRQDIPRLTRHFAKRAGLRLGGVALEPTTADLQALSAYDWPGNVRELAAVIERATILGGGRRLEITSALGVAAVPSTVRREIEPATAATRSSTGQESEAGSFSGNAPAALDAAMMRHIEAALASTAGKIEGPQGAAARLGINPHTLRARMRKLGIDWRSFRTR
ncbi:MAG: sigma-54 interaction domain-containing protein [Planctomycetota bacterium]